MNIQAIMKQAQTMQKEMMKAKEEIDKTIFEGSNSLVKVTVNGAKEIIKVEIDKKVDFSTEDIEALEDMVLLATNEAMRKVDIMTEERMGKFGNSIPGLF